MFIKKTPQLFDMSSVEQLSSREILISRWTLVPLTCFKAVSFERKTNTFNQNQVGDQMSRVFLVVTALYTGGQPVRRVMRGSFFVGGCLRALSWKFCFREKLSRTLLFSTFLKRELPHLHGHIFPFIGTSSSSRAHLPLHGHNFPSLAHLPLHGHIFLPLHERIFPFIGTSSPSWAHLPFHGHVESFPQVAENSLTGQVGGRRGLGMVWFREIFREAFAGIGALAYAELLTQIAYAKIIVKLLQDAYARLREPVFTNVSASAGST